MSLAQRDSGQPHTISNITSRFSYDSSATIIFHAGMSPALLTVDFCPGLEDYRTL